MMEYISETKIRAAIEQCLKRGNNRFLIYPYGKKGKLVKQILNEEYGIEELALVDNCSAATEKNIYSAEEYYKIFNDYTILFSAEKSAVRAELEKSILYANNRKNIIDIAKIPALGCNQFSFKERKMEIDSCSREQLEKIFVRTQEIWTQLGEDEPYWSVLSDNRFLSENIGEEEIREFYENGKENVKQIVATLIRNGMADKEEELKNCDITEIGCGCGRITGSLANVFHHVTAVDISKGNLAVAKNTISNNNVMFQMISVDEYRKLPKADVVYSYLVLQHNCPPVIEYMIDTMLKMLKPQGIAMFQVPTYERGYRFCYDEYMETEKNGMEMHVIPQQKVFEIAYDNHCIPLEVYQDDSTGKNDYSVWFIMKNRDGKND